MPGINLAVSANIDLQSRKAELERLQGKMKHDSSYRSTVLLAQDRLFLGFTGYDEYPISSFERGDYSFLIEGLVYNKGLRQVQNELSELAVLLTTEQDILSKVRHWILSSDGDYVVLILDRVRNQLFFFNDALGRLPLYCHQGDGLFLLSREVKFLTGLKSAVTYDRQAIAEYLLFGYILGDKTLVEGVSRLGGATLGRVDLVRAQAEYFTIHTFNFDECRHAAKPPKQLAGELKELFIEACRDISTVCSDLKQVVSLSGGLDSRSVAAGMRQVNRDVCGVTFQDIGSDAAIAEQVAATLGIEWQLFELKPFNLADVNRLVTMKDGLNYAGMCQILSFFDQLRELYGTRLVYYTGDGGDKVLPDLGPPCKPQTIDALVDFVIDRNCQFSIAQVEALTSCDKADIRAAIMRRVQEYPEQNLSRRYVHFLIFERGFKWLFEGEDRNRCFFWSASPFWSLRVFDYALNIPDSQKRSLRLYEQFMAALCPQCMSLDNARWGAPFASLRRYLHSYLHPIYSRLPSKARTFIKKQTLYRLLLSPSLYRGYEIEPATRCYLAESIDRCPTVLQYLSEKELRRLLNASCQRLQGRNLLSIVTYIRIQEDAQASPSCRGKA